MIKEKIIGALNGESEEEIEKEVLEKFGFIWVCGIGSRHDGSVIIDETLTNEEGKECELWVDYKNERCLIYCFGDDLRLMNGDLTKKEEKEWYGENK